MKKVLTLVCILGMTGALAACSSNYSSSAGNAEGRTAGSAPEGSTSVRSAQPVFQRSNRK